MIAWYRETETILLDLAESIQRQQPLSLRRLESVAASLVSSLQTTDELLLTALSGPTGSPLITNLINVGILGTKVGIGLGYHGQELNRLALAGLVHDIGLLTVPIAVVTKVGRLTTDERILIEQHPERGYRLILACGPAYHWLAHLVRQAHERVNGAGYPNRLKGQEISEMAMILGLVDVFDALISERPYRSRLLPHEAVKEILTAERMRFPREVQKALIEELSMYPLGSVVRLTADTVGTVVKVNARYPTRPVVQLERAVVQNGQKVHRIDLSRTPSVTVAEVVKRPVVGSISFSAASPESQACSVIGPASNQFTALLERLDAVAGSLQHVVNTRGSVAGPPDTGDTQERSLFVPPTVV